MSTAVVHIVIPRAQIQEVMGPAIHEVLDALRGQGLAPVGPMLTRHLRLSMEEFDIEVGFPISGNFVAQNRVYASVVPAALTATTYHKGAYEQLFEAWSRFGDALQPLLKNRSLRRKTELWESYLVGPESSPNPADWLTELNLPLHDS